MDDKLTRLFHSLDPEDQDSVTEFHKALERRGLGAWIHQPYGWALRDEQGWESPDGREGAERPSILYKKRETAEARVHALGRIVEIAPVFFQSRVGPETPEWEHNLETLRLVTKRIGERPPPDLPDDDDVALANELVQAIVNELQCPAWAPKIDGSPNVAETWSRLVRFIERADYSKRSRWRHK